MAVEGWKANGPCTDRRLLPLVDAAYHRPGGPAAEVFKTKICARCSVKAECLASAMEHGEEGVWGGTGPNVRTRAKNKAA